MTDTPWQRIWRPWPTRAFDTGERLWGHRMRRVLNGAIQDRALNDKEAGQLQNDMSAP